MSKLLLQSCLGMKPVNTSELLKERERLTAEVVRAKKELLKTVEALIASLGIYSIITLIINYLRPNMSTVEFCVIICTLFAASYVKLLLNWRTRTKALKHWEQIVELSEEGYPH